MPIGTSSRIRPIRRSWICLKNAFDLIKSINPAIRFIVTVSPVPLTATNSADHVLVATTRSKSILRAVAGEVALTRDDTDYFPSYELVTAPPMRGTFFEPNMREVSPHGVRFVMDSFFGALEAQFGAYPAIGGVAKVARPKADSQIVCEEELLAAFGGAA
jgi:hypothetical protein